MRKTGLISTLSLYSSCAAMALAAPAAYAAEEVKTDTIGPWQIEATFKGDKLSLSSLVG